MEWYSGDIGAGIAESKTKKLIFLVNIFDSKNQTNGQIWSNEIVIKLCKENCISLKLDADSQTCSFFKQIYPVSEYPTTYFIGLDGKAIEVLSGEISEEEFVTKFQKVIEIFVRQQQPSVSPCTSSSGPEQATSTSLSEQSFQDEQKKNMDEKVAKAREKLKEIQEKKRAEEEEKEKLSEIERRKQGQEILKAKREKEEQELRKIAEEKRREKLEDELAKKRILEKIRQDREEKQKKYNQEKNKMEDAKLAESLRKEQQQFLEKQAEASRNSSKARIQFRFVDGSFVSKQFESDQTLSDAKDFVIQKLVEANESTSFSMHTTFPKRKFTSNDMLTSLRDLSLTPSATILIIPGDDGSNKSTTPGFSATPINTVSTFAGNIFTYFFSFLSAIWGFCASLIGLGPGRPEIQNNANNNQRQRTSNFQSDSVQNLRLRNINNSNNVKNLNDLRDGDDENATWNGNSTQQM